jgi:SpoVK/Ycf46/Vps4 family AAA+-type ATPase
MERHHPRRTDESALQQLYQRVVHRSTVLEDWGLRSGGGRGEGIIGLFAGKSGTGKTLAAEVLASALGQDLDVINLATVVDKYIGETEKNLERIFAEAEGVNAVLFFDEADALFGRRSEVSDARDRYANIEVAYLLQRLETFDGLGILATNLRTNVDDAFTRRLSVVVDFPEPDAALRRKLWKYMLERVPVADDVNLEFCADRFELSGGNVRNIAVSAAYLGAANGGSVRMADVIHAIKIEYTKLGRLSLESEFGPYYHLVRGSHGPTRT